MWCHDSIEEGGSLRKECLGCGLQEALTRQKGGGQLSRQVASGYKSPVVGVKGEETWSGPAWQQHGTQRQPMWQEQQVETDMWVLWVVINVWVFILKTMRCYGEVFGH